MVFVLHGMHDGVRLCRHSLPLRSVIASHCPSVSWSAPLLQPSPEAEPTLLTSTCPCRGDGPQAFHRGVGDENEIQQLCATLESRGSKRSRRLARALQRQADTVKSSLTSKEDGNVGFSLSAGSASAREQSNESAIPAGSEETGDNT